MVVKGIGPLLIALLSGMVGLAGVVPSWLAIISLIFFTTTGLRDILDETHGPTWKEQD